MTSPNTNTRNGESSPFADLGPEKFMHGIAALNELGRELELIVRAKERSQGAVVGLQKLSVEEALLRIARTNVLKVAARDSLEDESPSVEVLRRQQMFSDVTDDQLIMQRLKHNVRYSTPKDRDLLSVAVASELFRNGDLLVGVANGVRELLPAEE